MMQALIIFIKNPVKGQVKTRLAKTIGEEQALKVYNRLLIHTENIASQVNAEKYIFYSQDISDSDIWDPNNFQKKLQSGGDLGEKMSNAFKYIFQQNYKKAVIVGSDIPALSSEIIEDAFERLTDHDIVVGPAMDGGYYLLGMNSNHPYLFQNISWSSDKVLEQTINIIEANKISYSLLRELRDLDTEEDYIALQHFL